MNTDQLIDIFSPGSRGMMLACVMMVSAFCRKSTFPLFCSLWSRQFLLMMSSPYYCWSLMIQ